MGASGVLHELASTEPFGLAFPTLCDLSSSCGSRYKKQTLVPVSFGEGSMTFMGEEMQVRDI